MTLKDTHSLALRDVQRTIEKMKCLLDWSDSISILGKKHYVVFQIDVNRIFNCYGLIGLRRFIIVLSYLSAQYHSQRRP